MPARAIKKELMDGWWEELRPEKHSLRQEGEAFLSAYDSVQKAKRELSSVQAVVSAARRRARRRPAVPAAMVAQRTTELLQDAGDGVDALGLDVPPLRHFARAEQTADYYEGRYKYGRTARRGRAAGSAKTQALLDAGTYPAVGFPWLQSTLDSGVSGGPASTMDTAVTCPHWIPNCRPQHNSLKACHFSCGAYCQAIRGDGPCFSGDSEGEGVECKFGYRGAKYTPDPSTRDESGWLEGKEHWAEGGPDDCMTCPVGFKIRPEYGDGTGRCVPCPDGWLDPASGRILMPGCAGGQFVQLGPGEGGEPGQLEASTEYEDVAGCEPTAEIPEEGGKVLAKVPTAVLKESPFFLNYTGEWYAGVIYGWDKEADILSVKFDDGGPLVEYDPGVPASLGTDVIPLPDVGDKVTVSQTYWDACCNETYNPARAGPLVMGEIGEVLRVDPPADGPDGGTAGGYTVLAPDGRQWIYSSGEILKLVGEVKCPLPGEVTLNTVGQVPNNLLELKDLPKGGSAQPAEWWKKAAVDPDCCCCARDLWVGCWGWCGDGTTPASLHDHSPKRFRAGYGSAVRPS